MAYTLTDVMNSLLTAVQEILGNIAQAIVDNAAVIAQIIVIGGLVFGVVRFGSSVVRRITGFARGLF